MKKYTLDDFFAGEVEVYLNTKKQAKELLEACEKRGFLWNSGDKPTKLYPPFPVLCCVGDRLFTDSKPKFTVKYEDLIKTTRAYQIIIDCDGDTTTAKMIVNGKEVKTAQAKRNPADKFNWKMGAQLAFDRLFGEKKDKKPKQPGVFKVGDRVVCTCTVDGDKKLIGEHGHVVDVKFYMGNHMVAVEFEKPFPFLHSCMGASKNCNGWWFFKKELRHE